MSCHDFPITSPDSVSDLVWGLDCVPNRCGSRRGTALLSSATPPPSECNCSDISKRSCTVVFRITSCASATWVGRPMKWTSVFVHGRIPRALRRVGGTSRRSPIPLFRIQRIVSDGGGTRSLQSRAGEIFERAAGTKVQRGIRAAHRIGLADPV